MNKSFFLKALLVPLFVLITALCSAQGGWSGESQGAITRGMPDHFVWEKLALATGTTADVLDMDTVTSTSLETGDTISPSSITPPSGVRTLCVRFVEASGTDARLTLRISGRDHFGRMVQSTLAFTSSGTLITDAAFASYPEPAIYVVYSTGIVDADSLYIYSYGQALTGNPQGPDDIRGFYINGVPQTAPTAEVFGSNTRFSTKFSTWNPATDALPTQQGSLGIAFLDFAYNTSSYDRNTVVSQDGSTAALLTESKSE